MTGVFSNFFNHDWNSNEIKKSSENLKKNQLFSPLERESLQKFDFQYNRYCSVLDSMVYLIYQRGYRDLGLEGEMISYIYHIEKASLLSDRIIFEVRRNEREYRRLI